MPHRRFEIESEETSRLLRAVSHHCRGLLAQADRPTSLWEFQLQLQASMNIRILLPAVPFCSAIVELFDRMGDPDLKIVGPAVRGVTGVGYPIYKRNPNTWPLGVFWPR
ncbi:MAG TPA: hypothetical protein VFE47_14540 [Tepidisphaeraceae bacterium]|jgi:hypothetical protein|nr:hypothetical protein [Tepidisphaeraceae bacterium]